MGMSLRQAIRQASIDLASGDTEATMRSLAEAHDLADIISMDLGPLGNLIGELTDFDDDADAWKHITAISKTFDGDGMHR